MGPHEGVPNVEALRARVEAANQAFASVMTQFDEALEGALRRSDRKAVAARFQTMIEAAAKEQLEASSALSQATGEPLPPEVVSEFEGFGYTGPLETEADFANALKSLLDKFREKE